MTGRTLRTGAAAAVAVSFALSGCISRAAPLPALLTAGSGTSANRSPTSTTPPARSASGSTETPDVDPVLAKIPGAARPNTQAGAEAFGRFFMEQVAESWTHADPTLLDGLFDRHCKSCSAFRRSAAQLRADGLHHDAVALTVTGSSANVYDDGRVVIAVPIDQNIVNVVDSRGHRARVTKPDEGTVILTLGWSGRWVVKRAQAERLS
jgi:hypothetical protein